MAETINVDANSSVDFNNIQAAINAAFDGDTVLVADGTYAGPGNRDIDFLGKAITVRSESGPENCIIDCQGSWKYPHRGFYFHSGEDLNSIVDGFTITNGYASGGGAIYCYQSSPTITNCAINGNSAEWAGGGIFCYNGSPTITNCTISDNSAGEVGGGGIDCEGGSPTIINCIINGNSARGIGGGILCEHGSPTITNCTINGNSAAHGGGIGNLDSSLTVTNSILWGNTEEIYDYTTVVVTYSDVQGSWPGEGNINIDPIFAFSSDGHLMSNSPCIDAGTNSPPGGLPETDLDGSPRPSDGDSDGIAVADMGAYEFNPNSPAIAISATTLFYIQAGQELTSQALLIRNCSGGTLNWEIVEDCNWLVASPTNGISTGDVNEATITVDTNGMEMGYYRFILRVHDPNATNSPRTVTVNLHVSEEIVYVPRQFSTIQEAIEHVQEEGEVLVADGTYTGPGNRDIDFLGKAITVRSESGPEDCIIDCQQQGRGFYFHNGEDANSLLNGFTIFGGHADGWSSSERSGGGIHCTESSPTITNCTITGNSANKGGGIYCDWFSSPMVTNCIITDNSASNGGAIYCLYAGDLTITNCTISGNWAYWGGGISCVRDSSPTITSCTIYGNSAGYNGGGIFCDWVSSPTISNCTISSNLAKYAGGGIYSCRINPTITNCIFWGNEAPDGPQIYLGYGYPSNLWVRYSNIQGGWPGEGNINAIPRFVEPGYWDTNGLWVEGDYHLLRTSPCIDAGDPNYIPEPNETDLDGQPRIINGRIDMGAYETNYIQAAMKFTPQALNCNDKGKYVKAHLTLPEGFLPEDVDVNEPAVAEPIGIESESIKVLGAGPVRLEICFDREDFCAQITETGEVEVTVIGSLTTSRYFYATDTIKIKP